MCMGLLHGRAERLTVQNGGFRPLRAALRNFPRLTADEAAALSPVQVGRALERFYWKNATFESTFESIQLGTYRYKQTFLIKRGVGNVTWERCVHRLDARSEL
jgi:hypothetical protein